MHMTGAVCKRMATAVYLNTAFSDIVFQFQEIIRIMIVFRTDPKKVQNSPKSSDGERARDPHLKKEVSLQDHIMSNALNSETPTTNV